MTKKKQRELICTTHGYIQEIIEELLDLDITTIAVKDIKAEWRRIRSKLKTMNKLVGEALDAGQAMENRLSEYRNAIEDLGFIRDEQ